MDYERNEGELKELKNDWQNSKAQNKFDSTCWKKQTHGLMMLLKIHELHGSRIKE
jgi:hypothetical protein